MEQQPQQNPNEQVEELRVEPDPVAADSYQWLYSTDAGVEADGPAVAFDSQSSAESWLADNVEQLLESGVSAVSLSDGSKIVYGPMPLQPA